MLKYLNPLNWTRWQGQFFYGWFLAIRWRDAPKAIPAIILLLVLVVTSFIAWSDSSDWRMGLLNRQLQVAFDEENYETAELVIMRQLHRAPEDARLLYRLALTKDELDKSEDAVDLMRGLANFKRHEQAARWLLEKEYMGKEWGSLEADQKDEFGRLLALIHEKNPDDLAIKRLYADYLIASEKFTLAVPVLEDLSRIQPMRGLQGAAILRKLGNNASADRLATRTLESVAQLSEEDPTNSKLALAVAQNQLFLKRYSEAVRTLERAIRRAATDEQRGELNQAMGDAMVAWVTTLEQSPNKSVSDRLRMLKMLQVALEHAPNNPRVLTVVADQVLATMNEDDQHVRAVREALIEGSSAGIAHFIRGTCALMKDDIDSATTSLKLAAEHMPHSGAILNNLAVALSIRDDSDLEQALKISESALRQTKNPTPHFFETRGQILYRLGRYLDAIPDLERALAAEELVVGAHETLAECYAEIGEQELSRLHREAAGDLAAKSTPEEVADSLK